MKNSASAFSTMSAALSLVKMRTTIDKLTSKFVTALTSWPASKAYGSNSGSAARKHESASVRGPIRLFHSSWALYKAKSTRKVVSVITSVTLASAMASLASLTSARLDQMRIMGAPI
eukprot:3800045-Prymnesium_polylepis.1